MARPNFIELPARDLAASQAFFETVFGMTMTGFGPTYACTLTGDVDIGLQADQAEVTKAPLPVIEVTDLEATLAAVTATGAPVTKPIFSFPSFSYTSTLLSLCFAVRGNTLFILLK